MKEYQKSTYTGDSNPVISKFTTLFSVMFHRFWVFTAH